MTKGGDQPSLSDLRLEIDGVDHELLQLLTRRARIALKVGELKASMDAPVWRPEREAQVIAALQRDNVALGGSLPSTAIAAIWTEIMSACRALERRLRVAFLGPTGTFSESALRRHFGDGCQPRAGPRIRGGDGGRAYTRKKYHKIQ